MANWGDLLDLMGTAGAAWSFSQDYDNILYIQYLVQYQGESRQAQVGPP